MYVKERAHKKYLAQFLAQEQVPNKSIQSKYEGVDFMILPGTWR